LIFDLVIRGGSLASSRGLDRADIAVKDGVIRAVARPGEDLAAKSEIDATGKYVLPGLVDAHVHIPGHQLSGRLDNFETATQAAALGGVTTIMLMPTDDPRTATPAYFARKRRIGEEQSFVDFAIQAMASPQSERADIEEMADQGAVSFELFLAYGGNPEFIIGNDDFELHRLLQLIGNAGRVAGVTPHSGSLIAKLTQRQKEHEANRKYRDPRHEEIVPPAVQIFAVTRPALSEALGIARACTVAAATGTRVHFRALSAQGSVDMVRRFRDSAALSSEVMSHHLLFTEEEAFRFGPYGIIVPPIRSRAERDSLRLAVQTGQIDMVVSDHSPVLREDKERGWANIWQTLPGMPGLQTLLASMLALADDGIIGLPDIARICAERPATCFGLAPRKGALVEGADADLVVVDPTRPMLVEDRRQRSRANYTTLKGRKISSRIERVFLRGELIAHEGEIVGNPGGRFVRP